MFKSIIILALLLVGCDNRPDINDPKYRPAPKGKYKTTECGLKIELNWGEVSQEHKKEVLHELSKTFSKYSYAYYIDSSLTEHTQNSITFDFHNHCEKKEEMLKAYAHKHLEKIKNFPKYTIVKHIPEVDKNGIIIYSHSVK